MPRVVNTNIPPYESVALLKVTYNDGSTGWGTGALIGSNHVLTCAHNLISRRSAPVQYQATAIRVFPGYHSDRAPDDGQGVSASQYFYPTPFREQSDRTWDIGVVRLAQGIQRSVYFTPTEVTGNSEPPKELSVAGYPGSHHYWQWEDQEVWTGMNVQEHVFAYVHETEAGSSGSPVFHYATTWPRTIHLYGVHSGLAENLEDKVGVLITNVTNAFVRAVVGQPGPFSDFLVPVEQQGAVFEVPAHALAG